MSEITQLPARSEVNPADTWDLASLFPSDDAWETAFTDWERRITEYAVFQGRLGETAGSLARCLQFDLDLDLIAERLGNFAFLKTAEDVAQSNYQRMQGRFTSVASRSAQAASFIRPEILAIPAATMQAYLEQPVLAPYRLILERVLRYKPHTLGQKEENLLAMQTEMAQAANQIFRQLNDADLKFGTIANHEGRVVELSHASFSALLHVPDRSVRREAFHQYYREYSDHAHTLAASLSGSIHGDIYYAKARNYKSALEAALFPDQMPVTVYDNLITSVHNHLPQLHRYYDVRRRKMGLDDLHQYDTYVPILAGLQRKRTWDEAVDVVMRSLEPLGSEYCGALEKGLRGRWCDRYENRNKQSGAFSSGTYESDPYILMNYQADVLDHVFTLTHEAGHSMHSWHSARHQPFAYYNYVIFVAEVASTFNEQLLSNYLLQNAASDEERAFLINRQLDAIRGTIFRQTMFAEFEKLAHHSAESGEPLTLERLRDLYGGLLKQYFGPEFVIDDELSLERLRIPHFYRAFYVYKYATGMSAAITLASRVTGGGPKELNDYLTFLKGGCSKDPLDLLRDAGVDMEQPAAVDGALKQFGELVDELDTLL